MRGFSPIGRVIEGMPVIEGLAPSKRADDPLGRSPDQEKIKGLGNGYLDPSFPHLCRIKSAKVEK